jgi:predicted O-methyltransferase YrrM
LASSFGEAQRFGVKVVGVEKNPDSVRRARAQVEAAGLSGQIALIEGDIFHLETIPDTFLSKEKPDDNAYSIGSINNSASRPGRLQ